MASHNKWTQVGRNGKWKEDKIQIFVCVLFFCIRQKDKSQSMFAKNL